MDYVEAIRCYGLINPEGYRFNDDQLEVASWLAELRGNLHFGLSGIDKSCFDSDGEQSNWVTVQVLRLDPTYCRIAWDEVQTPDERVVQVSTVWLGVDSGPGRDFGFKAMIFETMLFGDFKGPRQWRYHNAAEARTGHAAICDALRSNGVAPEL